MKAKEITEWIADDAIRYVRKHKSWSEAEESLALEKMNDDCCSLSKASPSIANEIHELL